MGKTKRAGRTQRGKKQGRQITLDGRLEPSAMPEASRPMLCSLANEPPDWPGWIFEDKLDGLRILARFDGRELMLLSRNGKSQNVAFPDVVQVLEAALKRPFIVDGEVVCFDADGRTSFRELQQRFHLQNVIEVAYRAKKHPAFVYLFDVLYIDHFDVTSLMLSERKELLQTTFSPSDRVRLTSSLDKNGTTFWRQACREGREGIVCKRLDSLYVATRSDAWVKVKCIGRQELVIGGWTDPQRSRAGLGALLVGYYSDDGRCLIYAGKVGTGFTRETLLDLRALLKPLGQARSTFGEGAPRRGPAVHWVEPRLVAEITFGEWTQNGLLVQPRFEGLRTDKKPKECRRERPGTGPRRASAQ
jgi:DNA ligase D-like protein (predicted ligase)